MVIQTLLSHKSIRKYKADMPPENVIRTIVLWLRGKTVEAKRLIDCLIIKLNGEN
ncbi:MAG: hypothetical protein QXY88_03365 [Candidatus Bathyarchaeia archaeon]